MVRFKTRTTRFTRSSTFLFSLFLVMMLLPSELIASTRYVSSPTELPVRSGQGPEYRIISVLQSGTKVQLLEESGTWSRVKMANGQAGWVPARYLNPSPPAKTGGTTLPNQEPPAPPKAEEKSKGRQKADTQEQQMMQQSQRQEQPDNPKQPSEDLKHCLSEKDQLRKELDKIKPELATVATLKQQLAETTTQLQEAEKKLAETENNAKPTKGTSSIWWFLAGAGVLVAGIVVGMNIARSQKRKGAMY